MIISTQWCALGVWPCLSQAEWVAVWSGIIGAGAAFLLSIAYQAVRRGREGSAARRNLDKALAALRTHLCEPDDIDMRAASQAVIHARAAFSWVIAHPEHFPFDQWTKVHKMSEAIEIWFIDNGRLGGFQNSLYAEQGSPKYLQRLGKQLAPILAERANSNF
ncbi:hypothetical protein GCM10023208_24610 [Erythrobacter westpacificensis]|uniref:DUF4760 domain-containing protein n=1 Tax=Erythrobacter westpacificensis TaxID=1055231 RepID=A0ABP9KJ18_9SPHN